MSVKKRLPDTIKLPNKTPYIPIPNFKTKNKFSVSDPNTFSRLLAIYIYGFSSARKINCGIDHIISKAIIQPTNVINLLSVDPIIIGPIQLRNSVINNPKPIDVTKNENQADDKYPVFSDTSDCTYRFKRAASRP